MAGELSASEWAADRGERWRAHLSGMEAMLAPVEGPLIAALDLDAPCRIADVGCGGGGTTLAIASQAPAGSTVEGFDISPALIEAARARRGSDQSAIAFALADVATAPAPADPFDRLASRFGVMFFDEPPRAFANLIQWLAPGGRFAFAIWGPAAENPWVANVLDSAAEVIDLPEPGPDAPGMFRYARAETLLGLLERAGFAELEVRDWRGVLRIGGGLPAGKAADFALASFSVAAPLAEAGAKALDEARDALKPRLSRHEQNGVVRMEAYVHIVTGAAPA